MKWPAILVTQLAAALASPLAERAVSSVSVKNFSVYCAISGGGPHCEIIFSLDTPVSAEVYHCQKLLNGATSPLKVFPATLCSTMFPAPNIEFSFGPDGAPGKDYNLWISVPNQGLYWQRVIPASEFKFGENPTHTFIGPNSFTVETLH